MLVAIYETVYFNGIRRFITVFRTGRHSTMGQQSPIHTLYFYYTFLISSFQMSISIPSGALTEVFQTKILNAFLFPQAYYMPNPSHSAIILSPTQHLVTCTNNETSRYGISINNF
jgi:hypothetical protein